MPTVSYLGCTANCSNSASTSARSDRVSELDASGLQVRHIFASLPFEQVDATNLMNGGVIRRLTVRHKTAACTSKDLLQDNRDEPQESLDAPNFDPRPNPFFRHLRI